MSIKFIEKVKKFFKKVLTRKNKSAIVTTLNEYHK